jgi:hypothetical protein
VKPPQRPPYRDREEDLVEENLVLVLFSSEWARIVEIPLSKNAEVAHG